MITISPGQAILLLLDRYKHDSNICNIVKRFYLTGIPNHVDLKIILELFQESGLSDKYQISYDYSVINEDPSRRYFETHLAYETLLDTLDRVNLKELTIYRNSVLDTLDNEKQKLFMDYMSGAKPVKDDRFAQEYTDAIKKIHDHPGYSGLSKSKKEKLILILQCSWLAVMHNRAQFLPLGKVYESGLFAGRGKIQKPDDIPVQVQTNQNPVDLSCLVSTSSSMSSKTGMSEVKSMEHPSKSEAKFEPEPTLTPESESKSTLKTNSKSEIKDHENSAVLPFYSRHFGLMKQYMPVPKDDVIYAENGFSFVKPSDQNNFDPSAEWPKKNFAMLVHPFSCGISGTTLMQLRVMKYLKDNNKLVWSSNEQFTKFLKCFMSGLLFNSGGHGYYEFIAVLKIPDIKNNLKFISDFDQITAETLLLDGNERAFNQALNDAIAYNKVVLAKQEFHARLTSSM